MRHARRLWVHALLLLLACVAAYSAAQPDKPGQAAPKAGEVDVWVANASQVTRIRFEGKRQSVTLERKTDAVGSYYLGAIEPLEQTAAATDSADGGAPPPPPKAVEAATFVSVKTATRIAEKLAPLRAKRLIGQVAPEREAAFGLDKPAGTLIVDVAGKQHKLIIGGRTPGASQRYVRDDNTKQVYVVDASIVRDLDGGAARLAEHTLHEWRSGDVATAKLSSGDHTRVVIRSGSEGRRFWADPDAPDVNDETAANWLGKVARLRPVTFRELPPGATQVVRVDYSDKSQKLGFVALYQAGDEFYVTTEQLRLYATVAKTLGEQVRDDLTSLLSVDGAEPAASSGTAPSAAASSAAAASAAAASAAVPAMPPHHP